jgi:hypothetical protein
VLVDNEIIRRITGIRRLNDGDKDVSVDFLSPWLKSTQINIARVGVEYKDTSARNYRRSWFVIYLFLFGNFD